MPDVIFGGIYDVIVIGGGPSGGSAARLLASWGYHVLLLTKPIDRTRGLAESLPPSSHKLLATIGLLEEMEQAGFYRTTGNTVWWGSRERRVENFDPSGDAFGFQVFRPDLDQLLLDSAARAGAKVIEVTTTRVLLGDKGVDDVEYERAGERVLVGSWFVLDCSGRTGVIARQGYRRYEANGRMQAFIGVWERESGWSDLPDETQTLVETYEDGWSWSVPVVQTMRHVGAMVEATTTRITRGPTIEDAYRAELAKTRELRALMRAATLRHVWACDASMYDAVTYVGSQFLLVGDAASFIDPLSSFGVKKALASGWLAAIVAHTSITHPIRKEKALEFFSRRERQMYATNLGRTRDFARRAQAQHPSAFWEARASLSDPHAIPGNAADELDEEMLLRAPAVQAAFDQLKRSPAIDFAWAESRRVEEHATIRGIEIVLEDAVALRAAGANANLRYLAGVDLITLGDLACQHRQVADLYDAYCRAMQAPVSLPGFLGSLSVLIANGVLRARSSVA